eukprot:366578-Chlamydomonas_euryale.AAC.10
MHKRGSGTGRQIGRHIHICHIHTSATWQLFWKDEAQRTLRHRQAGWETHPRLSHPHLHTRAMLAAGCSAIHPPYSET